MVQWQGEGVFARLPLGEDRWAGPVCPLPCPLVPGLPQGACRVVGPREAVHDQAVVAPLEVVLRAGVGHQEGDPLVAGPREVRLQDAPAGT